MRKLWIFIAGVVTLAATAPPFFGAVAVTQPDAANPGGATVHKLHPGSLRQAPRGNYVGAKECRDCHSKPIKEFLQTTMGKIFTYRPQDARQARSCEACHGPGERHIANPKQPGSIVTFGKSSPYSTVVQNSMCEQCHNKGTHRYWKGSPHELRGLTCVTCHTVMRQGPSPFQLTRGGVVETCAQCHDTKAAKFQRSSHMPLYERKLTCTSCHNPHGSQTDKMLNAGSVNQLCFRCHAEKRGPFLWQHPPVAENCLNCHTPHGSIHESLLKMKRPRLCQQCHSNDHASEPRTPASMWAFNRACQNCHVAIHGSNHPAGQQLTR